MNQLSIKNISLIYFAFYISLIFGFYLGEDFALGYIMDYELHIKVLPIFNDSIVEGFLNYEDEKVPHSPIYLLYMDIIIKFFDSEVLARFFHLHIALLLPFFLYKSLKEKFKDNLNIYLYFVPLILFFSPYFRSGAIWIDDNLFALVFLSISIFFFIKYENNSEKILINIFFNIFFLALAAYVRPIYSLFGLYFFTHYLLEIKSIKILFFILLCNLILSYPAVYYVFILGIDGWFDDYLFRKNIITVVSLSLSVLFFYFLPILIFFFKKNLTNFFNFKDLILFLISLILLNIFFDYDSPYSGGIFFKTSVYLFDNLIFYYLISSFSLIFILKFLFSGKYNKNIFFDFLLLIILLTFEIDGRIYHEAYDPLFYLLIFTLFKNNFLYNFVTTMNVKKYLSLLFFALSFYFMSILKSSI